MANQQDKSKQKKQKDQQRDQARQNPNKPYSPGRQEDKARQDLACCRCFVVDIIGGVCMSVYITLPLN